LSDRHLSSWPPHAPKDIALPETSLWRNLELSAARSPAQPCTVFYDSTLSYAELARECERLAGFLQHVCGVKRGDRVGLFLQNSPQFVIGFYAILRADAVVVPINPMNRTAEIDYMLKDSGSTVLVAAQDLVSQALPLLGGEVLQHLIVATYSDYLTVATELELPEFVRAPREEFSAPGLTRWSDALAHELSPSPHTAGAQDLCVIPYTSGTTGFPKGCMHMHQSVMHTAVAGTTWHNYTGRDSILAVLPLFHVTGMQNSMNGPIYVGGTLVLMPRWNRAVAAQLVQRYKVTSWTAVPTMVVDFLSMPDIEQYDLSSIRAMGGGGAAMPEAIAQKLQDLCGLTYIEGYGLTETVAPTHINPPQRPKKQCLGIPIFGTDSRVVDPETLYELMPGEVGEIVTHGPQVFKGYWNNPEATAAAFIEIDGKRFFRTGDLGRVDEDGYFFLVDRLKRMINVAGFKVWPAEVEAMLYAHPAVLEAAVIATNDPRRGEAVMALVVPKSGMANKVSEESFIAWAQSRMAAYKVPRQVRFLSTPLPKLATGKIDWRQLQDREAQRQAGRGGA
jgi:fatty-acyl-CoA synthase